MNKWDEMLPFHQFLYQMHGWMEEVGEADVDLGEYQELGVAPNSTRKSRSEHKEAIQTLMGAMAEEAEKHLEKPRESQKKPNKYPLPEGAMSEVAEYVDNGTESVSEISRDLQYSFTYVSEAVSHIKNAPEPASSFIVEEA